MGAETESLTKENAMKWPLPFSIAILVLACGPKGAKLPQEAESAMKLAKSAPALAPSSADPKAVITDDRITRHLIFQREMAPVTGIAMEVGMLAMKNSGGNQKQFQEEMAKDPRVKRIADAEASAVAKSGLSRMENMEISRIVSDFTPGATMGDAEMKKQARADFQKKYGDEVLAVLEKRLPDLAKLQEELLSAALKPKGK